MGHGGAAFYEEEYIHVIAAVEFELADWEEVGMVALGDLRRRWMAGC